MRNLPVLSVVATLATALPAFAQTSADVKEIGTIVAEFQDATIEQTVVMAETDTGPQATGYLLDAGSMAIIAMHGLQARQLSVELTYMTATPGAAMALGVADVPLAVSINWFPTGFTDFWSTENAPTPAIVTLDVLEIGAETGRAEGRFEAVLCHIAGVTSNESSGECAPISGSFATDLYWQEF